MNITIDNTEKNIINEISALTNIHKERLFILETTDISSNYYSSKLHNKIILYTFYNYNEIYYKLNDNDWTHMKNNSLLFLYSGDAICIKTSVEKTNLNGKIIIFDDLIENCINYKFKEKKIPLNNIFILENKELITDLFCSNLIKYIDQTQEIKTEKWGNKTNVNCRYVNISEINETEIKKTIDNYIYKIINYVIDFLHSQYDINCSGDSGYCLRKIYGPTRLHKDGISVDSVNNRYIPIKKIRNMSVIICLNDDYEGGEFYFPVQDFKIKLKKGQIIAFPPYWTHPHMSYPLLNRTYRYTINTWLYE